MKAGVSVARALTGSWRDHPPPAGPDMAAIADAEEQLMRSGAGGLVWWRIRSDQNLSESPIGQRFLDAFKLTTLQAQIHESRITRVFKDLGDAGLEPLLYKGWDCARTYPHPGMRPYGDIDLCLLPHDADRARSVLAGNPDNENVDFEHHEIETAWIPGLFDRCVSMPFGEVTVRVMGPEDRLRTLALHALYGEVWIPRSLCDVALDVESRPKDFDWDVCLTQDPIVRNWVLTAIALACELLGSDPTGVPATRLPQWVGRRTLKMWSSPWPTKRGVKLSPLPSVTRPLPLLRGLIKRWPGPIQATLSRRAKFGSAPRLPLQITDVLRRTVSYSARRPLS